MAVAPIPVFFLLIVGALTKVPVVSVGLVFPPAVVHNLVVVPDMVIVVVAVMNRVARAYAGCAAGHQDLALPALMPTGAMQRVDGIFACGRFLLFYFGRIPPFGPAGGILTFP